MKYLSFAAKIAARIEKIEMAVDELRFGEGGETLTPEERFHAAEMHKALIDAKIKARALLPLTDAQELAIRREEFRDKHAATMD